MSEETFDCPNCGAPLDYTSGSAPTIRCPFCNNSVIVPAELRDHTTGTDGAVTLQPGQLRDIADLVRAGNKIGAIKLYRAAFNVGLKDAKDAVEALADGRPVQIKSASIGSPSVVDLSSARPIVVQGQAGSNRNSVVLAIVGLTVVLCIVLAIVIPFVGELGSNQVAERVAPHATNTPAIISTRTPPPTSTRLPTPSPTPGLATVVTSFGQQGTGPGFFNDARSIAVDGAGRIYVADYTGGRVQAFDPSGNFITQWNAGNSKTIIDSIAANRQGTVYVVADEEIKRYEGATGKSLGSLSYPAGNRFGAITVTGDGSIYSMWYEARFGLIMGLQGHREDLVHFDSDGKVTQVFRSLVSQQSDSPELDARLAVDGLGNIFVLASNADQFIFSYNADGRFLNKFSTRGSKPGQLNFPQGIALDGQGRIYVSDSDGVHVFESNGQFVDVFKAESSISQMVFNFKNELLAVARTQVLKFALNR
jgi:LSD1 subclass zinc finger protein